MAEFEEIWERGRVVIRRADARGGEGPSEDRRGAAREKEVGLVAKALASLRSTAAVQSAPTVDTVVRLDGRGMEKGVGTLEDSAAAWQVFDAARYSGKVKVDPVLKAHLGLEALGEKRE